jgi:hypothetical protein
MNDIEYALTGLKMLADRFPQTARDVQENINEEFGKARDGSMMAWTLDMYSAAFGQFTSLYEAGEVQPSSWNPTDEAR